jgi:hypothetical protein
MGVDLGRVGTGVAAEVWRRHLPLDRAHGGPAAALTRSCRRPAHHPSLLLPWLISTVVMFGVGALVSLGHGRPLVWLLAPAVAAVGIAIACGPEIDPAQELSSSCVAPAPTFGWLLPMPGVSALGLAAAVAGSAFVGAGAGVAAWVITVLASETASGQLTASVTNAHAYLPYLAVAACGAAIGIYAVRPERGLQ